jgi:hypothetical protein
MIGMPSLGIGAMMRSNSYGTSLLYRARFELKYDSEVKPLCTGWFVLCYPDGPTFKGGYATRKNLIGFIQEVTKVRSDIDEQRARDGLEVINWHAYTSVSDPLTRSLESEVNQTFSLPHHGIILADFWSPAAALDRYFEKQLTQLGQLSVILDGVERVEGMGSERAPDIGRVRRVINELKKLHIELEEQVIKLGWKV